MANSFHENDYLGWYMPLVRGHSSAINLHASGVAAIPPTQIRTPPQGDPFADVAAFEEALAKWLGLQASEILFTPGATGGTLLALMALCESGDEILVERPIYEPMLRQARRLGKVGRFDRRPEDGWGLPMDELASVIGKNTGVVMITEPHNPSGTFAPREQVERLARICEENGAHLLINEIYRRYTDAPSHHRITGNTVIVSSLSKLLGAYWARLGWISASPELTSRLRRAHWNMGMPTTPGARAGLGFMARVDELNERATLLMNQGIEVVDQWVRSTPGVSWHRPDGAGFGFVRLPDGVDDLAFVERLHTEKDVLVIPGRWFERPGSFRLSWLQVEDRLPEGLGAIADLLI